MSAVTISRQYGSGGRKIAAHVAELLGYRFFDKRLMLEIALKVGLLQDDVIDFTEDDYVVRSFMERLDERIRGQPPYSIDALSQQLHADESHSRHLSILDEANAVGLVRTAICAAYKQKDIVIVGRGGQVILQDMPDVVHVRIQAPLSTRRERLVEYENVSLQDATQIAIERDEANRAYMKHFYGVNVDDPELYHLILNTGKLDSEFVAQMIVQTVKELNLVSV